MHHGNDRRLESPESLESGGWRDSAVVSLPSARKLAETSLRCQNAPRSDCLPDVVWQRPRKSEISGGLTRRSRLVTGPRSCGPCVARLPPATRPFQSRHRTATALEPPQPPASPEIGDFRRAHETHAFRDRCSLHCASRPSRKWLLAASLRSSRSPVRAPPRWFGILATGSCRPRPRSETFFSDGFARSSMSTRLRREQS